MSIPLNQISKSRITGIIARALVLPSSVVGADADLSFLDGSDFRRPFLLDAPFLSVPWRGEQSFEDLLRKEGRKTTPPRDFVFLGIDQSTLQLPPLTPEELAGSRGLQLLNERPYPWSRELWALLLDRLVRGRCACCDV